jgi:hypothetical protein
MVNDYYRIADLKYIAAGAPPYPQKLESGIENDE